MKFVQMQVIADANGFAMMVYGLSEAGEMWVLDLRHSLPWAKMKMPEAV